MANTSDDILRAYMENVLRLQKERDTSTLSDGDLKQIALESGMTEADLEYVRKHLADCLNRGKGFIRYENWPDAIRELEQATTLAPHNVEALCALASAYAGSWREKGDKADRDNATATAERVLQIDSTNDTALRIVSAGRTKREDLLGGDTGSPPRRGSNRKGILVISGTVILSIIISIIIIANTGNSHRHAKDEPARPSTSTEASEPRMPRTQQTESPPPPPPPPVSSTATAPPGLSTTPTIFGREGISPGLMYNSRELAIDGSSRIYVAEYNDGRVQVFDSTGKYLMQWAVGAEHYVTGIAADRKGNVYVTHSGRIFHYNGETGEFIGEVKYAGGPGFRNVAVMANGGLAASWDGNWKGGLLINPTSKDNLVIFDANLHATRTIKNIISSLGGGLVFHPEVAVDGLGNIYMVGGAGEAVYHFNPHGTFVDRFSAVGSDKGNLQQIHSLAVDGNAHVFVADYNGIHEFNSDGRYLGSIELRATDGLAFDPDDNLYVVQRTKVYRFPRTQ